MGCYTCRTNFEFVVVPAVVVMVVPACPLAAVNGPPPSGKTWLSINWAYLLATPLCVLLLAFRAALLLADVHNYIESPIAED